MKNNDLRVAGIEPDKPVLVLSSRHPCEADKLRRVFMIREVTVDFGGDILRVCEVNPKSWTQEMGYLCIGNIRSKRSCVV